MSRTGPIIVIDDDEDDHFFLEQGFLATGITNQRKYFGTSAEVLHYLTITTDMPFLIICDVNLPGMDGTQLKEVINKNDYLRRKSTPFVFLTTTARKESVALAYEMMVQGYFVKPVKIEDLTALLQLMVDYWTVCIHPNNQI